MCNLISNEQLAALLAAYPHTSAVYADDATDGSTVYVARMLTMEGVFAQGDTPAEAEQELVEVKEEMFLYMIEEGLDISDWLPVVVAAESKVR